MKSLYWTALSSTPGTAGCSVGAMRCSMSRIPYRVLQREKGAAPYDPLGRFHEIVNVIRDMMEDRHEHQQGVIPASIAQFAVRLVERLEIRVRAESTFQFLD